MPRVLTSPREAFAAVRDDSNDGAEARQEPLLAVVWLAGIALVLETTIAGRLLDDPRYDALVVGVWAFIGGGMYGAAGYLVCGFLVYLGAALAGARETFRRARHVVGLAAVPVALSLAVWPLRLAVYGGDVFRSGGSDAGVAQTLFQAVTAAFVAWALLLLALGIRVVHGWSWPRTAVALALAAAPPALLVLVA